MLDVEGPSHPTPQVEPNRKAQWAVIGSIVVAVIVLLMLNQGTFASSPGSSSGPILMALDTDSSLAMFCMDDIHFPESSSTALCSFGGNARNTGTTPKLFTGGAYAETGDGRVYASRNSGPSGILNPQEQALWKLWFSLPKGQQVNWIFISTSSRRADAVAAVKVRRTVTISPVPSEPTDTTTVETPDSVTSPEDVRVIEVDRG